MGGEGMGSNPSCPFFLPPGAGRVRHVPPANVAVRSIVPHGHQSDMRWRILAKFYGILFFMPRLIALIIASTFLVSCSRTSGGVVGDYAPEWLGGMPKGVPPRPGTPEYDAFKKAQQAEAERDKSKDPARPKSEAPKGPK